MITYFGLAKVVTAAAGELSKTLPPGSATVRILAVVLRELKALARAEESSAVAEGEVMLRARGLSDRGLWRHRCGNTGLGTPVTDVPPEYCEQCQQRDGWERLYVNTSERAR